MDIKSKNITVKNLINKYNNSIYESYDDEDFSIFFIDMHSAS